MSARDSRKRALDAWARGCLQRCGVMLSEDFTLETASDDASFRRYFRYEGDPSYIFVDAPPEQEDSRKFVSIDQMIRDVGLNSPEIFEHDFDNGFLMMEDLGSTLYLDRLNVGDGSEIERMYSDAFDALAGMQQIKAELPLYDKAKLLEEMNLFPDWFLYRQLQIEDFAEAGLEGVFELMLQNTAEQPQVFVHRDYHCRNLMVTTHGNPGIIDFQDAVLGPLTYDLVSLLKDCYHQFSQSQISKWVGQCRLRLQADGRLDSGVSESEFFRWFELMGFQRHLKCAGIFSRLNIRDSKPGYLADIPLVIGYMMELGERYQELAPFCGWLEEVIVPRLSSSEFTRG
ncbi:MAG TPA: aminoglycoside phosphotransferase [Gammaproteobacteria bacterium]|nr:aminoglycoside phosphotransferase [Gammaproteobacteria bacterium]|tara:strand:+ start:1625 stop:2653 length:1029 start_codon:yes stop_codon:yes gene_type:complete